MTTTIQNMFYERAKSHYESIKPIRGSDNLRPTGDRRKQWMTIRQEGENYIYSLYKQDCVVYTPTSIIINTGKWFTPTTAEFITAHTPIGVYCVKQYKKLWLTVRPSPSSEDLCLPVNPSLTINVVDNKLVADVKPLMVRTVDRRKAKDARARLDEFITWGMTMLKLSDGWLTDDTRKEAGTEYIQAPRLRELLAAQESDYLTMYVRVLVHANHHGTRRTANGYWEHQYTPEMFKRKVLAIHDAEADIHDVKLVTPGSRPLCNTI